MLVECAEKTGAFFRGAIPVLRHQHSAGLSRENEETHHESGSSRSFQILSKAIHLGASEDRLSGELH
jgi:hypothetical protein